MENRTRTRGSAQSAGGNGTNRGRMASAFQKEEERIQKKRDGQFMPFRFWLKPGEEVALTFLDHSLDEGFYRHEHNLKIDGKWGNHEPCTAETGHCEHCSGDSNSALVGFLSVIVHKPYTSKRTGETVQQSKMLYTFKRGQFEDLERLEKIAMKKHGTLRGVTVWFYRKDEDNSFSSGEPVVSEESGELIDDFYDEDALVENFGNAAVQGRESGKIVKEENEDIRPYNYRKLMPEPQKETAPSRAPGSRAASQEAEEEYEEGADTPAPTEGRQRTRTRQGAAPQSQPAATGGRPRPATKTAPAAQPSGRPRTRRAAPEQAYSDEPTFEEEDDIPM